MSSPGEERWEGQVGILCLGLAWDRWLLESNFLLLNSSPSALLL